MNIGSNGFNGNGASFYDFNGDGFDDVSLVSGDGQIKFYINTTEGQFEEIDLGIYAANGSQDAKMINWVDIDNDGDEDLFISFYLSPNRLWLNNGDLTFTEISETCGILQTTAWQTHGVSWGDYDRDSYLDVYITNYNVEGIITNYLYRNLGDGTFEDVTDFAQVSNQSFNSFQSLWYDYNEDLWPDLVVINDRLLYPNAIYQNNGDGTFTEVTIDLNFDQWIYAMSITCGDYDNDDDFDIYVSNGFEGNIFMQYNGTQYQDIAPAQDMAVNSVCWGATWIDYDCDMWQDLYVSTYVWGQTDQPNAFFVNTDGEFSRDDAITQNDITDNYSPIIGDLTNDGYPDIFIHTLQSNSSVVLQNDGGDNRWLKVGLTGTLSNIQAIGSTIEVWADGIKQKRMTFLGENYLGQNSRMQFFGLGAAQNIDSLKVTYPSGHIDTFFDLAPNNSYEFVEGETYQAEIIVTGTLCDQDSNELSIQAEDVAGIEWQDGSDADTLVITESGEYSATITNNQGISTSVSIEVELFPSPVLEQNITNVTCHDYSDGMIELFNVSGIPIASCVWNNDVDDLAIFGLAAGTYEYLCTDENGCTDTDSIIVTQPDQITAVLSIIEPLCFGETGSVSIEAEGGTGTLEFDWNGEDPDALLAGEYTVEVSDELSCSSEFTFGLSQPAELSALIDINNASDGDNGSASAVAVGGTAPYNFQWSNGDIGEVADELGQGVYILNVTDDNGCTWSMSFEVIDLSVGDLSETINISAYIIAGQIHINNPQQVTGTISAYSMNGQLLMQDQLNGNHSFSLPLGFSGPLVLHLSTTYGVWTSTVLSID
ncbi:FG-GAP-like repeat-containing protein [Sanyastnella coralliicola]|uniref:FG-GAP-like repeat-containing protein n=1 Tax=Sanyastnella coralliicola TaxID=3069118 RepID=UPI0027BA4BC4|nr:FG-GAP-like repeat-containing protein [Longitalea sp. SCSIO 12813]